MAQELQVWNKVLSSAVKLPLVNVDREIFLKKKFSHLVEEDVMKELLEKGPLKVVEPSLIDKISKGCINRHLTEVTATSALAGLPGGWAMAATVPGDIAQFFGHVLALMQKLLYLHGFPSIKNAENEIDDETLNYITIFVGVMFGSHAAQQASSKILEMIGENVAKQLPRRALTKTAWYPIVKQVGKWLGVKITKDMIGKTSGKLIPLIGGPISGTLTYITFKPMAKRLHKHLKEKF